MTRGPAPQILLPVFHGQDRHHRSGGSCRGRSRRAGPRARWHPCAPPAGRHSVPPASSGPARARHAGARAAYQSQPTTVPRNRLLPVLVSSAGGHEKSGTAVPLKGGLDPTPRVLRAAFRPWHDHLGRSERYFCHADSTAFSFSGSSGSAAASSLRASSSR